MRRDEEAAVTAAAALFAQEEETTETVAQQGTEEVAEQGTEEQEQVEETPELDEPVFPSWQVELPEGLEEELDAPTDEEIAAEVEQDEQYEELDEDGRRLLARARAAERKAEHYERLRLQDSRKLWTDEAKKFFPLSAHVLDTIQADSRKGFLRQAKAAHEAVIPYVKEITDKAQGVIETEKSKAVEAAKKEAAEAWGQVPPRDEVPAEATITQERLARNRARGDLAGTIREMIFPKKGEG